MGVETNFFFLISLSFPQMSDDEDARLLHVLFGSQTGTASEVADRVYREARRLHFRVRLASMDEFLREDASALPRSRLVVFVCSTTGQGEVPDNMKQVGKRAVK